MIDGFGKETAYENPFTLAVQLREPLVEIHHLHWWFPLAVLE